MTGDFLQYDEMIQEALRGVMAQALESVARNGFPGEHHFLIVFRTDFPGVDISDTLRRRFPHEMTIVLQHQFWDLKTDAESFSVDLSFSNVLEHLHIPFTAVKAFTDPSVKFGLQYAVDEEICSPPGPEDEEPAPAAPGDDASEDDADVKEGSGDVISLDAFRKK